MSRITPRLLYIVMAVALTSYAISALWMRNSIIVRAVVEELGAGLAVAFCLKVAREHPPKSALKTAWLLLASFALVSMLRHLLDTPLFANVPYVHAYRHLSILLSLLCLLGGMSAMARAFWKTGLGFSITRLDAAAVAAIFGILTVILVMHEHLSEGHFPLSASRYLQLASQVVIAAAAAVSVVLHRFSVEMGGGKLAITMRMISAHITIRVLLVLSTVMAGGFIAAHPVVNLASQLCFDAAVWIFAIGACYRAQMFTLALRQAPPRPEEILAFTLEEHWAQEPALTKS
jgi:hypothetical protein